MTTYHVHVTREGDRWLADVPGLEGSQTYASSLTALDQNVREVIVLGADLPDDAMAGLALAWTYDIGDQLVTRANELRTAREALARQETALQRETEELAVKLTEQGYSARDAGPLLGVSHQRVSQISPTKKVAARRSAAAAASAADGASSPRNGRGNVRPSASTSQQVSKSDAGE